MNGTGNLSDIYNCSICFEPMKSAVSLNPCGHELNEGCANTILSSKKKCPICRADVDSFRPAYITRQAVEIQLENMKQPEITIHVIELTGKKYTYKMERNSKTIDLFKRIFKDSGIHPSRIKLFYNRNPVLLFSQNLSDYIPTKETEVNFCMSERLGHWTSTAEDYPLLYQKVVAEVGSNYRYLPYYLSARFSTLFEQEIDQAMNS